MISAWLGLPFPLGFDLLQLMPFWLGHLVLGVLVVGLVGCGGFILARLGISPLWALLMVIPVAQVAAYWLLAFRAWPREQPGSASRPPAGSG